MKTMELIFADLLSPSQLMEDDIIKYTDEDGDYFVTVNSITYTSEGYTIIATDDFGEEFEITLSDDAMVRWYVYPVEEVEA